MNEPAAGSATAPRPLNFNAPSQAGQLALGVGVFLLCLYCLTSSKLYFGYEGYNINQAEALLRGTTQPRPLLGGILPYTQGGVLDVAAYLPFTLIKLFFERRDQLLGLRQLAYTFTIPLFTTALCLVFYGIALELYRRARTAAALTLLLGSATMIWPYSKHGMETQQTLWTLVGVWGLLRWQRSGRLADAGLIGLSLIALPLTKITGTLLAAAVALAWFWNALALRPARGRPGFATAFAIIFLSGLAGLGLFLVSNRWRYGGWVYAGRYGMEAELDPFPLIEAIYITLFSANKNLWLYAPPLLLGLWYWGRCWRAWPGMRAILLLSGAIAGWMMLQRTSVDETVGLRRLHYLVPLLCLPAGMWWEGRRALAWWQRGLGQFVIACGILAQVMLISFDYSIMPKMIAPGAFFTQENFIYQPQLNQLYFNMHMYEALAYRQRTGRPLAFIYEHHYLTVTRPQQPLRNLVWHEKPGGEQLDLWFLQQRADWAGKPFWFATPSAWLVVALALGLAGSGGWLLWMGRPGAEERAHGMA